MKSETECLIDNEFSYSSNVVISKGNTHDIFIGNIIKDNSQCAIKTEEISTSSPQLEHEYTMLSALHDKKCKNIPKVYKYSKKGSKNILIMELLGHSIEKLFSLCNYKFSFTSSLLIIEQMLDIIKSIHSNDIIHRDIRPEHFIYDKASSSDIIKPALDDGLPVDINPLSKMYLIDFGVSKYFIDQETHKHIAFKNKKDFQGSAMYSSVWSHLGAEKSRRDDLDSIAFIMIYLLKGELPWQKVKAKTKKEIKNTITELKVSISPMELCKGIPFEECVRLIHYIRGLQFEEVPKYDYMRQLIAKAIEKSGYEENNKRSYYIGINYSEEEKREEEQEEKKENKKKLLYSVKRVTYNMI